MPYGNLQAENFMIAYGKMSKTEKANVQPDLNPGYEGLSSSVTGANAYYLNQ